MPDFKVRIYCPKVSSLPEETATERANRLVDQVTAASAAGVDIFLGPECFFTHHSASISDPYPTQCMAYSSDEAEVARDIVEEASAGHPGMLIVAGTFLMVQGVSSPHIFNTSFAYFGGGKLKECSKLDDSTDKGFAEACDLPFFSGDGGARFDYRGISCYLQICTDTTNPPPEECALSIVPSYVPGVAAVSNQRLFQWRILADGGGGLAYVYRRSSGKMGTMTRGPIVDVTITVPDT